MHNKTSLIQIKEEIKVRIKGKEAIIDKVLITILAKGHILLEDIPGVGKTTLALALSNTLSLAYRRMQFTPDVLPSDIIGFSMFNKDSNNFEYREGSIMTNLFLADEINRTSPKTQSALLEVMEEGSVTVDGTTHNLPSPFIVIATQNPFGSSGTQKLPESQLDRFMVCLSMGYPDHFNAIEILKGEETRFQLSTIISQEQLITMQEEVEKIFVDASIYDYIITLTEATRIHPSLALGISPRGSIALLRIAKASAYYNGRDFVIPQDVTNYIYDVFAHRLARTPAAKSKGITKESILHDIIEGTKQPKLTK